MKKLLVSVIFLLSISSYATPEVIEVIFLSHDRTASLIQNLPSPFQFYTSLASQEDSDLFDCVPMGEGCFHPQFGYIDRMPMGKSTIKQKQKPKVQKKKEIRIKTFNSEDVSLVDCDEGNYFDIFCGKSKAGPSAASKMEIWIDTSSSMRAMDYSKDPNHCKRRSFLTRVLDGCPKGSVSYSYFDTSLKEGGDTSNACISHGLNNIKRTIDWIKASNTKYLLIITDIDELSTVFRNFLNSEGAKFRGADVNTFTASRLVKFAKNVVKTCKKL